MLSDGYSTDGKRAGFYLGACTQGKSWTFGIKTGRSTVSMTLKLPINNFCEFLRFLRDLIIIFNFQFSIFNSRN